MSTNLENAIQENVRALTDAEQQQVLEFVEELREKQSHRKTIWEKLHPYLESIPREDLAEMPSDASLNLDLYLYGMPKKVNA